MPSRTLAIGCPLLAAIGGWFSPLLPRTPDAPAPIAGTIAGCALPPAVAGGRPPLQSDVPRSMAAPSALQAGTLTPLAGFSIEARVLSRED